MIRAKQDNMDWEAFIEVGKRAQSTGGLRDAEFFYKAALAMSQLAKVTGNSSLAKLLFLLGELYAEQHKYNLSEAFLRRSVAVFEKMNGRKNTIDYAITLKRLSEICRAQSKDVEAIGFAAQAKHLLAANVGQLEQLLRKRAYSPAEAPLPIGRNRADVRSSTASSDPIACMGLNGGRAPFQAL